MTAWEVIQLAARQELTDEDGEPVALATLPGLSAAELDDLEAEHGFLLPAELRELLRHCAGLEGPLGELDFTGRANPFGLEDVFPRSIALAGDGDGNFWVLDASPAGGAAAPVFFACHDPPVVVCQSRSLADFLSEVFRLYRPPHDSLLRRVQEADVFRVWDDDPGMTVAEASSGDAVLKEFASAAGESARIVDLRSPEVGAGFRFAATSAIRRHPDHRLFAYTRPVKRGLWARLWRR